MKFKTNDQTKMIVDEKMKELNTQDINEVFDFYSDMERDFYKYQKMVDSLNRQVMLLKQILNKLVPGWKKNETEKTTDRLGIGRSVENRKVDSRV